MVLKHPYLCSGYEQPPYTFPKLSNYEQRPGKYRVKWISQNGFVGHGDWVTYWEANEWVNTMREYHPKMTHSIEKYRN